MQKNISEFAKLLRFVFQISVKIRKYLRELILYSLPKIAKLIAKDYHSQKRFSLRRKCNVVGVSSPKFIYAWFLVLEGNSDSKVTYSLTAALEKRVSTDN